MRLLTAIGAFVIAWLLLNLVLPSQTAALLAAVVAIIVFFGYGDHSYRR